MSPKTKKASCNKKANCTRRHYRRKAKGAARKGGMWPFNRSSAASSVQKPASNKIGEVIRSLLSEVFTSQEAEINRNKSVLISEADKASREELISLEATKKETKEANILKKKEIEASSVQELVKLKERREAILEKAVEDVQQKINSIIEEYKTTLQSMPTQEPVTSTASSQTVNDGLVVRDSARGDFLEALERPLPE